MSERARAARQRRDPEATRQRQSAGPRAARDAGTPLEPGIRQTAERAYGADLSAVRVHTGPDAERAARDRSARAFTVGSDVVLGADGPRALLHELAHVVQQQLGGARPAAGSRAPHERAARAAASAAARGQTGVSVGPGTGVGVACSEEDEPPGEAEPIAGPTVKPATRRGRPRTPGSTYVGAEAGVRKGYKKPAQPEVIVQSRSGPTPGLAAPLDEDDVRLLAEADAIEQRLGRPLAEKVKAATDASPVVRSGFGKDSGVGTKGGGGAASTAEVLRVGTEIGHTFVTNASKDEGVPGQEKASHAEKQAAVLDPGKPIAVDKFMCDDCNAFFGKLAQRRGVPLVVKDPGGTWVFRPDGVQIRRAPGSEYIVHPDGRVSAGPPRATVPRRSPKDDPTQDEPPADDAPASVVPAQKPAARTPPRSGAEDPTAGPKPTRAPLTADQRLTRALSNELRDGLAEAQVVRAAVSRLDELEKNQPLTEAQRAYRAQAQARAAALEKSLSGAQKDLALLTEPGASDAALNELRARRGSTQTVTPSTESRSSGLTSDGRRLESKNATVTSRLDAGTSRTVTDTRTVSLSDAGLRRERDLSARVVSGDVATTTSRGTSHSLGVVDGNLTATSSRSTKRVVEDAGPGGEKQSTATTDSTSVGLGGVSRTSATLTQTGDKQDSTSTTRGLTRGDGQLGYKKSTTTGSATVDAEGNVLKGRTTTTSATGGLIAGPGQVGVGGTVGAQTTQTHRKGITTGQSATLGGKVLVTCQEVPGSNPSLFRVGLLINLSGSVGVSGGAEKKAVPDASGGGNASAALTASGSLTGSFTQKMSEEETAAYLGAVRDNQSYGAYRELKVIELAGHGALEQARTLLTQLTAAQGSAAGAKDLKEGQAVEVKADGTLGVAASAGGTGKSGAGAGVKLGYSVGGSIARTVAKEGGKIAVRLEVLRQSTASGGVTGSYGVASGGISASRTDLTGEAVSFTLDPDTDPPFSDQYARIMGITSVEGLRALAATEKGLVTSSTTTKGSSGTSGVQVGLLGVGVELDQEHGLTESVTTDAKGVTKDITAKGGGGLSVSLPGGPKVTSRQVDTFSARVGPDGKATGDAGTVKSETDLGATAKRLADAPIATISGALTGASPVLATRNEASGTKVDDDDYGKLTTLAQDDHAWTQAFLNGGGLVNQDFQEWRAVARRVRAAGGNREAVVRIIADYQNGGSRRGGTIQAAFGKAGAGIRYDFPDALASQKPVYDELVVGDPVAAARTLSEAGKKDEALKRLTTDLGRLTALQQAISAKESEVSDPAVLGEMLRRIGGRASQLRSAARTLNAPPPAAPTQKAQTVAPAAADPARAQADADVARADREAAMTAAVNACVAFRARENRTFAFIAGEYEHWYRKADVIVIVQKLNELKAMYQEWDQQVAIIQTALADAKAPVSGADRYKPDRKRWNDEYARNNRW